MSVKRGESIELSEIFQLWGVRLTPPAPSDESPNIVSTMHQIHSVFASPKAQYIQSETVESLITNPESSSALQGSVSTDQKLSPKEVKRPKTAKTPQKSFVSNISREI
jgi:hypothetical protein